MRHEFAVYRPARGGGSHHVRVEYQLRLRGFDGTCLRLITYRIYTCCKVKLGSGPQARYIIRQVLQSSTAFD